MAGNLSLGTILGSFSIFIYRSFLPLKVLGIEFGTFVLTYTLSPFYFLFGGRILLNCYAVKAGLELGIILPQPP